jgi:hypothetical protein
MESGGNAPQVLNLGTTWRRLVSFTLRSLYPPTSNRRYPSDRRKQSTFDAVTKRKNLFFACPRRRIPAVQYVASHYTDWATPVPKNYQNTISSSIYEKRSVLKMGLCNHGESQAERTKIPLGMNIRKRLKPFRKFKKLFWETDVCRGRVTQSIH